MGSVTVARLYSGSRSTPTPDCGREKNGPHGSTGLQFPSWLKDLNALETPAAIGSGRFGQFGCLWNLETTFHRDPIKPGACQILAQSRFFIDLMLVHGIPRPA